MFLNLKQCGSEKLLLAEVGTKTYLFIWGIFDISVNFTKICQSAKIVYKRVRGWASVRSLPVLNFVKYLPRRHVSSKTKCYYGCNVCHIALKNVTFVDMAA